MRTTKGAAIAAAALALGILPTTARAGGFEFPENGSIPMGRGGTGVARASDPSSIMLNTANIVGLDGLQITASSNLSFLSNCFTRGSGTPGPNGGTTIPGFYEGPNQGVSVDATGTTFDSNPPGFPQYLNGTNPYNYPQICNNAPPFIAPQLLATWRINRYFAVGLGVYGPNAVGNQSFPTSVTVSGMGMPDAMAPSPNRYMLVSENLLIIHPTLALAGAPFPWLRIGVGLQPSFADFQFTTMANSSSSQSPSSDILTTVEANQFFFAFNAGIQLIAPRYFSVGAQLHYNPDTITLTGTDNAHATFNPYRMPATTGQPLCDFSMANGGDAMNCSTFTSKVTAHLPWDIKWGVRFALPRAGGNGPLDPQYDPMRDDVFDIEIDWMYEHTSAFTSLDLANTGNIHAGGLSVPAPQISVPHNLHDTWGVRLGSDINIVPNVFAFRLGASYEMGGESVLTGQIDQPSYNTLGLHAGLSLRLANRVTISAAYGHFFMQDLTVYSVSGQNLSELGATGVVTPAMCRQSAGADACATNVGLYQAHMDVVNLGITARF